VQVLHNNKKMNATNDGTLLAAGTRVRIQGLVNSQEFNGIEGSVTAYAAEKKRYEIRIEGKKKMLLKPENIEMLRAKRPTFANIDDMMVDIEKMVTPDQKQKITPEQKQEMFRMAEKMDLAVDLAGQKKWTELKGIDSPSPRGSLRRFLRGWNLFHQIGGFSEVDIQGLEKALKRENIKPQVDRWVNVNPRPETGRGIGFMLADGRLLNIGCATGHDSYSTSRDVLEQLLPYYLPDVHAKIMDSISVIRKLMVFANAKKDDFRDQIVIFNHDEIAAGYDGDEYCLLGMAVKFAMRHGVSIQFSGRSIHENESRVADLQKNVQHYLPEIFAQIQKTVADGKFRVSVGVRAFCLHGGSNFYFF
jgi:hypothetical protein